MKYHLHTCPLCNSPMRLKIHAGVSTYYCTNESKSHYELESDSKLTIEHMYAFPYAVDNYESSPNSRLYKWENNKWKFVKESKRLMAEPQQHLRERLQELCNANL